MERVEKLTVRRSLHNTVVKLVVTEDGITVDYSVKAFESSLVEAINTARQGCDRLLGIAKNAHKPSRIANVVNGGHVVLRRVHTVDLMGD